MADSNIHTAINAIMKSVGYVQKQKSGGLNYSFAGEAALIAALRPAMVEQGVYMSVAEIRDIRHGEYTTAKGSVMQIVDLTATVRYTHAPSGTSIDVAALGSGADTGDKASNKALTGAYKYALRQTFCIETGDDPDDAPSQPRAAKAQVDPATGEIKANGHSDTLTIGQAQEALKAAGVDIETFKQAIIEANGRASYSPARDTPLVRRLIEQNKQPA